jgi:hypothetical protein
MLIVCHRGRVLLFIVKMKFKGVRDTFSEFVESKVGLVGREGFSINLSLILDPSFDRGDNPIERLIPGFILLENRGGVHYHLRPHTSSHDSLVSGGLGLDILKEPRGQKVGRKSNMKHAQETKIKEVN